MNKKEKEAADLYKIILDYYESFAHILEVGTDGEKRFAIDTFKGIQELLKVRLEAYTDIQKEQFLKLRVLLEQDTTGIGNWMKEAKEKIGVVKEKTIPKIEAVTKKKTGKKKMAKGRMERNIRSKGGL